MKRKEPGWKIRVDKADGNKNTRAQTQYVCQVTERECGWMFEAVMNLFFEVSETSLTSQHLICLGTLQTTFVAGAVVAMLTLYSHVTNNYCPNCQGIRFLGQLL